MLSKDIEKRISGKGRQGGSMNIRFSGFSNSLQSLNRRQSLTNILLNKQNVGQSGKKDLFVRSTTYDAGTYTISAGQRRKMIPGSVLAAMNNDISKVRKQGDINNAKEGMLCVRFVDQSKAVIKGMKDKINWGGIISPEGDLMLNGYIPYIYGNLFEYADFQDAWQKGFAKGWEIIQKDETLQNVKNIIDLQKLFKEKGFVKKRYE